MRYENLCQRACLIIAAQLLLFSSSLRAIETVPFFRTSTPGGEHFYTANTGELLSLRDTWQLALEGFEGHLSVNQEADSVPFYRLDGPQGHLYTAAREEVKSAEKQGYKLEGAMGYIGLRPAVETTALYRLKHPTLKGYFYTVNKAESDKAAQDGWRYEGIAGYVWKKPRSGQILEQFYVKEAKQAWWVSISFKDGNWSPGAGIDQDWRTYFYHVGMPGYKIVSYRARETSKNNNATWRNEEHAGFHYITLAVKRRASFGASNWVGVEVAYEVERTY